jgi:septum formation protein
MTTLVLASTSPYRKLLLERLGLPFETASPDVDETALTNETPEALVARLAEAKARAIASHYPNALIIGSDQVAVLDGAILGKPGDHATATQQLRNASGRQINFLTGLCLLNTDTQQAQVKVVPFSVTFRNLKESQIQHYLNVEKPYDCAGSFKSEGFGIGLFECLEGQDPNALIGLPLIELITMLLAEGVDVLSPNSDFSANKN